MLKVILILFGNIIVISRALDTSTVKPLENGKSDIVSKRDLSPDQVGSKSFNSPPPEYYRGPGSTFERDRGKDKEVVGLDRPFTPNSYGPSIRYPPKGGSGSSYYDNNRRPNHDRISVGHYGPTGSEEGSYETTSHSHYGNIPYGQPQPIDIAGKYAATGPSGYEKHPYGGYLPERPVGFDLYSKNYGDYGGGYPYSPDYYLSHKAELAKSFLIPLAGAAILGITAALIANPVLLQLGTVSAAAGALGKRRRRRRDLSERTKSKIGKKFQAQRLAYRAHVDN